jgi:type I restriction enzyme, S subunit
VLYIKDGATTGLATVNYLEEQFSLLLSVALLKPRRSVLNPYFLKYSLNSPDMLEAMVAKMTETAIQRLTLTVISSQKIALPPLSEQKRIVAKLDSLTTRTTRARKELDRVPSLIARYKQRLLGLAFSGGLTAAWRERSAKNSGWS